MRKTVRKQLGKYNSPKKTCGSLTAKNWSQTNFSFLIWSRNLIRGYFDSSLQCNSLFSTQRNVTFHYCVTPGTMM